MTHPTVSAVVSFPFLLHAFSDTHHMTRQKATPESAPTDPGVFEAANL